MVATDGRGPAAGRAGSGPGTSTAPTWPPAAAAGRGPGVPAAGEALRDRFGEWFPFGGHLIGGSSTRPARSSRRRGSASALVTLGTLAAGLAHELNNPAVGGHPRRRRAASTSRELMASLGRLARHDITAAQFARAGRAARRARRRGPRRRPAGQGGPRGRAADWLDRRTGRRGLAARAALAAAGADAAWCDRAAGVLAGRGPGPGAGVGGRARVGRRPLLAEVKDSTRRISELVAAVRSYSQMDRASRQQIDVTDGLESTLVMLGHKLRDGITVVRDYAADVPPIEAYPGELNQVWTNLIDNAVDAMAGSGDAAGRRRPARTATTLVVRDRRHRPRDARRGRGARLRAVLHHQGGRQGHRPRARHRPPDRGRAAPRDIEIDSEPGATVIRVRLPRQRSDG